MKMSIVSEVAKILRDERVKGSKQEQAREGVPAAPKVDRVSFSSEVRKSEAPELTGFEKDHMLHVERVKSLVQSQRYELSDHMKDHIAGKIASMFL